MYRYIFFLLFIFIFLFVLFFIFVVCLDLAFYISVY